MSEPLTRATLQAALDIAADYVTSHHTHDTPLGGSLFAVVAAAQAHLATLPTTKMWEVTGIDAADPRTFLSRASALEVAGRALAQGLSKSVTVTEVLR